MKYKMTTGLRTGDFTSLRVYSNGDMKDLLEVVTEAVAAGGGEEEAGW